MPALEDYIARIDEACGEEKDFIVVLKYEKRDEALRRLIERGRLAKSYSGILFDIVYKDITIRAYKTGKMILKKMKGREEVENTLKELLL